MLTFAYRNHVIGLTAILIIFFFDITEIISLCFDLLSNALDSLLTLSILLYEWIEFGIEGFFEHTFQLDHHQAEFATFYTLLSIAILLGIYLWITLPHLSIKLLRNLKAQWFKRKRKTLHSWRSMSLVKKTQWFTITIVSATSMLLLV